MWRQPSSFAVLKIAGEFMSKRQMEEKHGRDPKDTDPPNRKDMLSSFMEIQSTNESIPPW